MGGAAVGPQGLLSGRVLQRFVEQIINPKDLQRQVPAVPLLWRGGAPSSVHRQSGRRVISVENPQVQFLRRWLTCPLCATSGACRDSAENCGGSAVGAHRQGGRRPCCAGRRSGLGTVEVPQIQFVARVVDLQFSTETGAFSRVTGAVKGFLAVFRIFRAPPGCPRVERQFSEPSMTKSSSSSRDHAN